MTGKHPPPVGGRTLADELRDDLRRCEDWVAQIGMGDSAPDRQVDGLALLRLLDQVADELERLEQRGVDLRPERARFDTVLAQLRRRGKKLVSRLGERLIENRPPKARWWWYLDDLVLADRRRRLTRIGLGVLGGLMLLALAFFVYDRALAPPEHIRQANSYFRQAEEAAVQGDLTQAVEQFERVTKLDPEHWEAYLWLGVLYQVMGDGERAEKAFEQGRAFFDNEAHFLLQRGTLYLVMDEVPAANQDALEAIEELPERPEGYFLLGSTAEYSGDVELAAAAFRKAAELAKATGQVDLEVTARMRLANLLQSPQTVP